MKGVPGSSRAQCFVSYRVSNNPSRLECPGVFTEQCDCEVVNEFRALKCVTNRALVFMGEKLLVSMRISQVVLGMPGAHWQDRFHCFSTRLGVYLAMNSSVLRLTRPLNCSGMPAPLPWFDKSVDHTSDGACVARELPDKTVNTRYDATN